MWVAIMLSSSVGLLTSLIKYLKVMREARSVSQQLRLVSPAVSSDGATTTTAPVAAPHAPGHRHQPHQQQQQPAAVAGMTRSEMRQQQGELLDQAQVLAKRAHKIEARALLYPTLYVPDVGRALKVSQSVRVCKDMCVLCSKQDASGHSSGSNSSGRTSEHAGQISLHKQTPPCHLLV